MHSRSALRSFQFSSNFLFQRSVPVSRSLGRVLTSAQRARKSFHTQTSIRPRSTTLSTPSRQTSPRPFSTSRMTSEQKENPITAFAVFEPNGKIQDWSYEPLPLAENEVEIAIEACGVCHSDLNQVTNYWGAAKFPLVVGHEIVGTVIQKGSKVTDLEIGQRVGVGPQSGHCGSCKPCTQGLDQLCPKKDKSYNTPTRDPERQPNTYGGFAERTRVLAEWAFPIPDSLSSVNAAPLLCAGLTTWSPFVQHKITKGHRVGVVGIGGLGHIALQFANKLGAEVIAISRTSNKKEEALSFGATSFLVTEDEAAVAEMKGTLDFILATVSASSADWGLYFSLLAPAGTMCLVGIPSEIRFNPMDLVARQLSLAGSYLCSNADVRKMLEFCAENNVVAKTETLPMNAENAQIALDKVDRNEPRYRVVLVNEEHPNQKQKQEE